MTPLGDALRAASSIDDTSLLQMHLEEQLTTQVGRRRSIAALSRRLCPYTSSFRIDELDVGFDDGSSAQLVLKDLGRDGMVEQARARPAFLYAPLREINAYRWVLPQAPAGTPALFGAIADAAAGRYWLFLERVKGLQLPQVGRFETWQRAAAWAARLHTTFSPLHARQIAERAGALVYDDAFYWRWMRRAQEFVTGPGEERRIVADVARRFGAVVDRL